MQWWTATFENPSYVAGSVCVEQGCHLPDCLLAAQFRFLYEVKALMLHGKGKDAIKDELKAHPYRVQLAMKTAQRLGIGYLMHILEQLATLDQNMKAGRLDKKLGFEMFLLGIQGVRQ